MTKETSTSSIRINPKVWEDFKIWCIRNKIAMSEKLEQLIKEEMKK
jgi:Txe/YoeB family toxin of Txe-Axe toxin-antitoxin module